MAKNAHPTDATEKKYPLNLPDTPFPMRGNLPTREPQWVQAWDEKKIYQRIIDSRRDAKKFILHDGPPYANGKIHVGHAINKILKDIIIKEKTLEGYQAPYVPGWDCHGMPIEVQIEKLHGKNLPTDQLQRLAREYATEQSVGQLEDFKRLGVLGDWHNPYRTMNFKNEAAEVRALRLIMEKGYVYRGLKPVNWCFDCQSALAEAEVEYQDKASPMIDVAFELCAQDAPQVADIFQVTLDKPTYVVIWTTTPWTIPANQALNMHPELTYALVDTGARYLILAQDLVESALKRYELTGTVIATAQGERFENIRFKHPLYDVDAGYARLSPVYLADYVESTAGTGIVHSAPAYGVDDFISCKKHGLTNNDILTPVMGDGTYAADLPLFGGENIWKVSPKIVDTLRVSGNLLSSGKMTHSYMHCWRHKTPLIYRATAQWFVRMDAPEEDTQPVLNQPASEKSLRQAALEGVEATKFFPQWGINRLHAMIANRPDWCISRQRNWGVPLPFFLHKVTGQLHPQTIELLKRVEALIEAEGIEAWSRATVEDFLGQEASDYTKSTDILDVWFDSGVTHYSVLRNSHANELAWPADLYLEGSDQHRGWFHSSLLTGTMLDGRPPYKQLLTHGFCVDENGEKMSKSKGNTIQPQEINNQFGAEILRLWVASTDYSGELRIGPTILKRVVESYRRLRNTLRFLLANTSDFDVTRDLIATENLLEIDRWALAFTEKFQQEVIEEYRHYRFHNVVTLLQTYASTDLGSFYLDILKDRLYTTAPHSHERRSAQTALWFITKTLLRLMSPILSFTAEEAFAIFSPNESETIFTEYFEPLPEVPHAEALLQKWQVVRTLRAEVMKAIEEERMKGTIGASLQAQAHLSVRQSDFDVLSRFGHELRFIMLVSAVTLSVSADDALHIDITPSSAQKCERCWHYVEGIGSDAAHPTLCPRCVANLFGQGEKRLFS